MAISKRYERMSNNCWFEQQVLKRFDGVVDQIEGDVDDLIATVLAPAFLDYWFELIDEDRAAEVVDLTDRTLQKYRQQGGGPPFIRVSSRCIKYRRIDLRRWSEDRLRSSTSDVGE